MPTMILNPFKGKNILITNGASGLGLAMAKEFAALKANIAIIAENKEQLGAAQREIEQSGSGIRCIAYACEITDPDTLNDYINMTRYEFGTIDGIVALNDDCQPGIFHESSRDAIDQQIDINLKSTLHTLHQSLPHLLENGSGFIALHSATPGSKALYGLTAYSASKAALNITSHVLRKEYAPERIRVHLLLSPGPNTPNYLENLPNYPKETRPFLDPGTRFNTEFIARKFVRGIANNKKTITIGHSTRLLLFFIRLAPSLWDYYQNSKIRSIRKQVASSEISPTIVEPQKSTTTESESSAPEKETKDPQASTESDQPQQPAETPRDDEPAETSEPPKENDTGSPAQDETHEDPHDHLEEENDQEPEEESYDLDPTDLREIIVALEFEDIKPFLDRITKYVRNLDQEITNILMGIADMDSRQDKSWEIDTGNTIPFRIDVAMNPDDTIDMRFYTSTRLSLIIDQEYTRMVSA
jgi:NAD(P)-dependent dehydrogenase (short-subunit alcohol dehydrogenase family)